MNVYTITRTNDQGKTEYFRFADWPSRLWFESLEDDCLTLDLDFAKFFLHEQRFNRDVKINTFNLLPL